MTSFSPTEKTEGNTNVPDISPDAIFFGITKSPPPSPESVSLTEPIERIELGQVFSKNGALVKLEKKLNEIIDRINGVTHD